MILVRLSFSASWHYCAWNRERFPTQGKDLCECVRDMALGIPMGLAKNQQLQLKSLGKFYVAPVKVHLP